MAVNQSDPVACSLHGSDPQLLLDPPVRECVYASVYWKARCLGRSAAGVVHLAARLRYVGGTYGATQAATPFLCLLVKLLQVGPEPNLMEVYLKQREIKYARVLAAFYTRLVRKPAAVYQALEPLLADHRKLVVRTADVDVEIRRVDEVIEQLLTESVVFGVALPTLQKRVVLVETGALGPRETKLPAADLAALDAAGASDENLSDDG